MTKPIPLTVNGVPVRAVGKPMIIDGETWRSLIPEDDDDERIWEFSETTGRIFLAQG